MRFFAGPQVDEVALRERVRPHVSGLDGALPAREELRRVTAAEGIDFATAWLHEAILASAHGEAARRIERQPLVSAVRSRARVVVVPTLFWREHPEIGGDGRLVTEIARRLGLAAEVADTLSLAGVEENAGRLLDTLARASGDVWVVTLSKGALELKRAFALGRGGPAIARVRAWVNISGVLGGSPLVDRADRTLPQRLFFRAYLGLRGGCGAALFDMGRESAAARATLDVPSGVEVLSVVPLPLPCHLPRAMIRPHRRLAAEGPNDGFVAFWDAVAPGTILPVWGCDHYLRTPALSAIVYRVLADFAERHAVAGARVARFGS